MGRAILEIYGGPNNERVNLLNPQYGYLVCDFRLPRPEMQMNLETSAAGVQYPRSMNHAAATTTFTLNARNTSQDKLIADERKLNRMLQYANRYHTNDDEANAPVYIRIKARDETVARFAEIATAMYHDSSNPFAQPFASIKPASQSLAIAISHDFFQPELARYPQIFAFSGRYSETEGKWRGYDKSRLVDPLYNTDTFSIANYQSQSNLTHVFTTTYGGTNVLDLPVGTAYELFPDGDWTYLGCETGTDGAPGTWHPTNGYGKFANLTFHLPETENSFELEFEYLTITGWKSATVYKRDETGRRLYSFRIEDDWAYGWADVNGVYGWWMRARRVVGSATDTVITSPPYTAAWNHIVIPEYAMGDAGCKVELEFDTVGHDRIWPVNREQQEAWVPTRIFMGVGKQAPIVGPDYQGQILRSTIPCVTDPFVTEGNGLNSFWDIEDMLSQNSNPTSTRPWKKINDGLGNPYHLISSFHTSVTKDNSFYRAFSRDNVSMGRLTFSLTGKYRVFARVKLTHRYPNAHWKSWTGWANVGRRRKWNDAQYQWNDVILSRTETTKTLYSCDSHRMIAMDLGSHVFDGDDQVIDIRADLTTQDLLNDAYFNIQDIIFIPDGEFFMELDADYMYNDQFILAKEGRRGAFGGKVYRTDPEETDGTCLAFPDKRIQFNITEPSVLYFFLAVDDLNFTGTLNSNFHMAAQVKATFTPLYLSAIGDAL